MDGRRRKKVALGAIFAAATLAAFALVGLVLMMGDVNVNGAETQQLLDARDEIKQLSNMIKNKVHTDQSFDTQKTTPKSPHKKPAANKKAPAKKASLAQTSGAAGAVPPSGGSGLALEVRKTVARLKGALSSLEQVENIMG